MNTAITYLFHEQQRLNTYSMNNIWRSSRSIIGRGEDFSNFYLIDVSSMFIIKLGYQEPLLSSSISNFKKLLNFFFVHFQTFLKIKSFWRLLFCYSEHKFFLCFLRSQTKFGSNRFSRLNFYWTNWQMTDKQSIYIEGLTWSLQVATVADQSKFLGIKNT